MLKKYDENLLLGYIEGELSSADAAKVQQWLRDDSKLERLLRQMIADRQALRRMPDPAVPAELVESLDRQIERAMLLGEFEESERGTSRSPWVIRRLAIAAAVALLIGGTAGLVLWSAGGGGERIAPEIADASRARAEEQPAVEHEAIAEAPEPPSAVTQVDEAPSPTPTGPTSASVHDWAIPWTIDLDSILAERPRSMAAIETAADDENVASRRIIGRVDEPLDPRDFRRSDRSGVKEVEVSGDQAIAALARLLEERPAVGRRCRIEITTTDPQRTRQRIAEVSKRLDGPPYAEVLRIAAADLARAIATLRLDRAHLSVRLYRQTSVQSDGDELDFESILTRQLPLNTDSGSDDVWIAVTIAPAP